MAHPEEHARKLAQVIAKSWHDAEFAKKLKADPEAVLRAEGIDVPKGTKVRVHEDTEAEHHLVIPRKPRSWKKEDVEKQRVSPLFCPLCTF